MLCNITKKWCKLESKNSKKRGADVEHVALTYYQCIFLYDLREGKK